MRFGTAGIPGILLPDIPKVKDSTLSGIYQVSSLGLDALEIEFVRGVYLKLNNEEQLEEIKQVSKKLDVSLSIHCPYYINLSSLDKEIMKNSVDYIVHSLLVGQKIGAEVALFHPGYFQKQEREVALSKISKGIEKIILDLDKKGNKEKINIGLELTGKETQVGSFDDIFYFFEMYKTENILPVIDFSHQHARYNGFFNNNKNMDSFFEKLKSYPDYLKKMHMHISGINYTEKGERNHLMLEDKANDLPYLELLKNLKILNSKGTIISESPIPYKDALFLKERFKRL